MINLEDQADELLREKVGFGPGTGIHSRRWEKSRQTREVLFPEFFNQSPAEGPIEMILRKAISEGLSKREAHLIIMKGFEGLSVKQISAMLNIPPRTVDRMLQRARMKFKEYLQNDVLYQTFGNKK